MRRQITNMASVAIIYRYKFPSQIFIEVKDDGHPIKLVRRQLCLIGGNWIGEAAKNDPTPLATLHREIGEELSLERPTRSTVELAELGQSTVFTAKPTPISGELVVDEDRRGLETLRRRICMGCVPYGAFLNTVSREALQFADPENTRDGFTTLVNYFSVALDEETWEGMLRLQNKFGNLSNESITTVIDLSAIVYHGVRIAFGHDRVLRRFFLERGFPYARNFPLVDGINSEQLPTMMETYDQYLKAFDVLKRPQQ